MNKNQEPFVVVRLKDNKKFVTYCTGPNVVGDYPQDWFDANPGKKPPVVIPKTKLSKEALSRTMFKSFIDHEASSVLVRAYLYSQLCEVSEICPEDWRSYGINIAKKGERVSVFSMLDVTFEDLFLDAIEDGNLPNDKALIANILCICRMNTLKLSPATAISTSSQIGDRFSKIYDSLPYVNLTQGKISYKTWANDRELLKIAAAIDMFFFRFSSHPMAHFRLGTVVFRFKDCAAIESLLYVIKREALETPCELKEWMWTKYLTRDIDRLYAKDMGEAAHPYSYFPYSVLFGIMKKSPYSVTANPAIHAYCQAINVASSDIRGVNARLVMAAGMHEVVENGLLTAYALGTNKRFKILFAPED